MASSARIDELRKKFEENPRRYFAPLANEYRKAGDVEQAISICREYLPQQPGHMSGHIVYGQALYEARQFEEAKTVFETALSLDPENLIALRHLGDIALIVADTEGARSWYRRVLEADPRNEEIQAQLATLDLAAATELSAEAPPTLAPAPVAGGTVAPSSPTPAVGVPTASAPAPRAPSRDSMAASPSANPESRFAPPAPNAREPIAPSRAATPPAAPAPRLELDSSIAGEAAMPGAPSLGMAGLETTSLTSSESPGSASGSMSTAPTVELDLPPAIPGSQKTPGTVEAAPLAPPNAEFAAAASSPLAASPTEPAGSAPAASQFLDLDSPPAGALPESPAPTATPIPFLEIGEPGAPESPSGAADAGPFVTETMAELYLRQGHREEALRVYRALLDQRPGDPALAAKVASLQTIATGPAPADPPRGEVDSQQWQPTIREVLGAIAQRRPGSRPAPKPLRLNGAVAAPPRTQPAPSAEPSVAPAATILSTVSASPVQPGASSVAAPPTTSASSDAISRLFGNAQISSADEGAAQSLALAFADTNGAPGVVAEVGGTPARRASNELSLDTVFGGGEGGAAGGGGASPAAAPSSFSFDQFFSTRASTQQSSGTVPPGSAGTASPEEVAHFTKWLEGLKQR